MGPFQVYYSHMVRIWEG